MHFVTPMFVCVFQVIESGYWQQDDICQDPSSFPSSTLMSRWAVLILYIQCLLEENHDFSFNFKRRGQFMQ